ncbi:hypothetical protein DSM106972_014600 [Dulcicalothrix desertica PCC 7102]|uniref:Uncharacterized protein n=1 Tax=Dulcicalothrix desertica PCC 7102 TaxID=232991 RepID=A0A3S1J5S8_9CYAN|nr:hypothetical protein [Dulcicalothrix desertica]RUT08292.1 hypothetical protein DSM106972_014600 [Dulcicalothrix desertica PCC 7102]TWH40158.1 hypothetical protein CAL7102_09459 [Dulcicalothrix desertica PCC 7102]
MNRRSASIALTTLLALPVAAILSQLTINPAVARSNRCNLTIQPNSSRYPRGANLSIRFEVRQNGHPVANTPVLVQESFYHEFSKRTEQRILTQTVTNHHGAFTLNYQVPVEVFKDKVNLSFVNPVASGCSSSYIIPIGR